MEHKVKALIERIERERGQGAPWRRLLAERDPEFLELYHNTSMHVLHKKTALPLKVKEIIAICISAVTFFEPGFRVHVRDALKQGVTEEEIVEALEWCTLVGIHSLSEHLPALVEEVENYSKERR